MGWADSINCLRVCSRDQQAARSEGDVCQAQAIGSIPRWEPEVGAEERHRRTLWSDGCRGHGVGTFSPTFILFFF